MAGAIRRVTVTSDLGPLYGAQVRAVLSASPPDPVVIPLTDELPAHRIAEGAFLLDHLLRAFPPGDVHLAVVDPGVGGRRPPIAVRLKDGSYLVGPGNGLLDAVARRRGVRETVRLDRDRFLRSPRVGTTFDARDLFAPAARHLALGGGLDALGPRIRYHPRRPSGPRRSGVGAMGRIVHVDRYGNAITDLPSEWFGGAGARVRVQVGDRPPEERRLVRSYTALPRRRWGVVPSSFGTLEIAVREEPAAALLGLSVGDPVRVAKLRPRRDAARER